MVRKRLKTLLFSICCVCTLSYLITGMISGKPSFFGIRPFLVMTGSMEPTIRAHSLILTVPVRAEEVHVGDIVTYTRVAKSTSGGFIHIPFTVVHRVTAIENDVFTFQGDNETETDPPVRVEQIGYRVVWGWK
ncbi:MAG: S26 family signal peptidase [Lachnospiraceae bacterium]|nr:S26 family signal peptidase [Lachnospiraceae bacterium]